MTYRRNRICFAPFILLASNVAMPLVVCGQTSLSAQIPEPVEERIRWIEDVRRARPEIFARMRPYYIGVGHVIPAVVQREYITLKPFALDLLHPKYQAAIEAHPETYAAIRAAFDRATELAGTEREQRPWSPVSSGIWEGYEAEVRRIAETSTVPDNGTFRLLVGAVNPSAIEQLDPVTLPAWEAGLLDPEVSWTIKGLIVEVVAGFEDPGSTPILGWFGREVAQRCRVVCPEKSARTEDGYAIKPSAECEEARGAASHVAGAFAERPRRDIALELAVMLGNTNDQESLDAWREILISSPEWRSLLGELAQDTETASRIEPLLRVVGVGQDKIEPAIDWQPAAETAGRSGGRN